MRTRVGIGVGLALMLAAAAHAASPLTGTSWRLVAFHGADGTNVTPREETTYTVTFGDGGKISAKVDCNRATGTWNSAGVGSLRLGSMAMTRMACPPSPMTDVIMRDWQSVRSYVIH